MPGLPFIVMLLAAPSAAATQPAPTPDAPPSGQTYGPDAPPAKRPAPAPDPACRSTSAREIIVCAQRKQGYRLDPDVMEARREIRGGGKPRPPETRTKDNSCATVGPMGCTGTPTIDLVNAAMVLANMATKAVKGEDWASAFKTGKGSDEYLLYVEAKHRREAREAEQVKAAAVKLKTEASSSQVVPSRQ
jgi:hypothetical protein